VQRNWEKNRARKEAGEEVPKADYLGTGHFDLLYLWAEHRDELAPSARVYLVTSYDDVGSDGKTHAGPQFPNPLVVDGPGHSSWAYATFDPVAHSKLHDQVAMPDANNGALFDADPEWQLIRIGLGLPACKTSVLVKVAPAPVVGL
jgi:hypothetical protein